MRIFLHSYGANEHLNIEVHQSIKKRIPEVAYVVQEE